MTTAPTFLAAGFVTPAFFVAGVLLAAIPIIIHILNRRRFKTVTWAAMDYLLRAMRKNRRRLKFEQLLLLATRCAVLGLLGAALARPVMCEDRSLAVVGGRSSLSVIVLDNSYSMGYRADHGGDAKTHFEQAKNVAKALINRLTPGGESVAVVTTARTFRTADDGAGAAAGSRDLVYVRAGYDLEAAKDAIDRLQLSALGTDLPGAMQQALEIGRADKRQAEKRLYVLSDATRSAWEGQQAQALQQVGPDLAQVFRVVSHYNLSGGRQQMNLAVAKVEPRTNLVTTKIPTDLAAVALGFGNVPEAGLRWTLGGSPLPETSPRRYETDPNTAGVTQNNVRFPSGGPQVMAVSVLAKDGLEIDDTRYRVIDAAAELKTLIVEGQRGANVLEGSGSFLQIALSPPAEAAAAGPNVRTTNSYVSADLISDLELGNKVLDEYRAIILAGVGQVPAAQAEALKVFVEHGGTLMLFMGEPVSADNYNRELLPRKLIPGPLVKRIATASNESGFVFDFNPGPNANVHPFVKEFTSHPNSGLNTAQVFTYWQVEVPAGGTVETVLNYLPRGTANKADDAAAAAPPAATQGAGAAAGKTGQKLDPAITVHSLGQGRVVFVSTTANADWTSFPAKPAYVTLMHELLSGSVKTGDHWMNLTVGQPLEVPPTVQLPGAPTLVDEFNKPVVIDAITGAKGQLVYRSRPLTRPGVYRLSTGNRVIPVVVNVPPTEADVRVVSDQRIREALGGIDVQFRGDEMPAVSTAGETGNDLSWIAMVAVFVLLLLECFMAMRFGHYRRTDVRRAGAGSGGGGGGAPAAAV